MYRIPSLSYENDKSSRESILITKYVNAAIETELRKYFIDENDYDKICAVSYGDVLANAQISNEEINMIDTNKLLYAMPLDYIRESTPSNVSMFLTSKFIQLVKIMKSPMTITPDLYLEMMLVYIGLNADDVPCKFAERSELLKICEQEYEFTETSESYNSHQKALHNLKGLTQESLNETIPEWLLWDIDYSFLMEEEDMYGNVGMHLRALLYASGDYSDEYIRKMYTSVGFEVPRPIENAIRSKNELLRR